MHSSDARGQFRVVVKAAKFETFNEKWNELKEVIKAEVWSVFGIWYFFKSWKLDFCFDILFWKTSESDIMSSWSLVRILNGVFVRTRGPKTIVASWHCHPESFCASEKFLRVESCHPESLDFLGLCYPAIQNRLDYICINLKSNTFT